MTISLSNAEKELNGISSSVKTVESCSICGSTALSVAVDLPGLPLTGRLAKDQMREAQAGYDQTLLFCSPCQHAQAGRVVPPDELYKEDYQFRTSLSRTAQKGTAFFLETLERFSPKKRFHSVLDLGCNDLYLLNLLKGKAEFRYGIDPIWKSREGEVQEEGLSVFGELIEDMNLGSRIEEPPDLIVCRHTLEHIEEPKAVLKRLLEISADDALFVFEVPGFAGLVRRMRFDQVFHQHLQYFTLASFQKLIEELDCVCLGSAENYHDWSAFCVVFAKKKSGLSSPESKFEALSLQLIQDRYAMFRQEMEQTHSVLESFRGSELYGYGAAAMLPILAYHLQNDLNQLVSILDDDPQRDQLYYWNLPLRIEHPQNIKDWKRMNIFLTAIDNTGPILTRLLMNRPQHIIYPFHLI